jgi:hypothetical protein
MSASGLTDNTQNEHYASASGASRPNHRWRERHRLVVPQHAVAREPDAHQPERQHGGDCVEQAGLAKPDGAASLDMHSSMITSETRPTPMPNVSVIGQSLPR